MGTPGFAVPTLEAIHAAGHNIAAVYTQPDRPKGRGQELSFPPVKECALRLGLPVHQPLKIRAAEVQDELRAMAADVMVVVGYGQLIPQSIIDMPRLGIVNVHASLLPKYRGAAPIQWAVANGESVTGVTTMQINAGLDTGDMLAKATTPIEAEDNALSVGERLSHMGAELLLQTLEALASDSAKPEKQNDAEATLAPILSKADGKVNWHWPAARIHNTARGFLPWPGAYTSFRGQGLRLHTTRPSAEESSLTPGTMFVHGEQLLVTCGEKTTLELREVQPEGRRRMSAADFRNGQRLKDNEQLGEN
jgi:methionyl-tRNA formyltransferase